MRNFMPYAGAVFLLSIACSHAQTITADKVPTETAAGTNVQAPPKTPIPPTPELNSVHAGLVAKTIDALPAAQHEKTRELNMIEDQNHAATETPPKP